MYENKVACDIIGNFHYCNHGSVIFAYICDLRLISSKSGMENIVHVCMHFDAVLTDNISRYAMK